jgi:molecular chaperone DnaK
MVIGIDLGTTFSAAAYMKNGVPTIIRNLDNQEITPSVVWFGDDEIIVGQQAKMMRNLDQYNVIAEIKKRMGKEGYIVKAEKTDRTPEDVSAIILKSIKQFCESPSRLNEKVEGCVITVPAYFNDAQKKATMDSASIAGLDVLGLINEPTAAALAYSKEIDSDVAQTVLVYDLGGGTFDITILNIQNGEPEVIATDGDSQLGGTYFDRVLVQYASSEYKLKTGLDIEEDDRAMQELWDYCEKAKISLSTREKCQIPISSKGKIAKIEITREKFEQLIKRFIETSKLRVENLILQMGLSIEDIDRVLLVGGSTQIPAISRMVEDLFKKEPVRTINPDLAVALGAAIYADWLKDNHNKDQNNKNPIIKDVTSNSLGITAKDSEGKQINDIIISKNTRIPCKIRRYYTTNTFYQSNIYLNINEGEDSDLKYVGLVGKTIINIPERNIFYNIGIEIGYDENGLIICEAFDLYGKEEDLWEKDFEYKAPSIGKLVPERNANLTQEQVEKSKRRLSLESVQ